ncbi:MAG: 5-formyltetrahydrofolate cyclo-ligase [Nitrospira sp.]|nr:5-formyltetrahydrofolate cyclo-ligase [Nitrospira sp.]
MIVHKKKEIRREVLKIRDALPLEEKILRSRKICDRLLNLKEFQHAKVVQFFLNTKSEVITEDAVRETINSGKIVVVPVVDKRHGRIFLSRLHDHEKELCLTAHGITEPMPEFHREVQLRDIELMVMPGVAFDVNGHRLGYGAGYYDRLLEDEKSRPYLVALSFELQMVEDIPVGNHDVKMDKIITEERIIDVRGTIQVDRLKAEVSNR